MSALHALAAELRWVAWRNEARGSKLTKVPYAPDGGKAKADDPSTWGIRTAAEVRAAKIVNGQGGGIGIQLGDLGGGRHLGGIDLDSCIADDGAVAPWAAEILRTASTCTERSPSGRGLKLFFCVASKDIRPILDCIGVRPDAWGTRRSVPGQDGRDHGPAIEIYFAGRYFTVTEDRWPGTPDGLATIDAATLDRLAALIPNAKSTKAHDRSAADNSRSAAVFRIARQIRRAGKTYEKFREAVRTTPETASWFSDKGVANGERELHRAFERAADNSDYNLPTITVRAGLRHDAADHGLAALHAATVPLYQRDRFIVRVCMVKAKCTSGNFTLTPGIVEVGHAFLSRALGRVARWEKHDRQGNVSRIDPPRPVVEQISDMAGEWPFPVLAGVIGTPTMRPDGTLLVAEGYDESTGFVLLGAPKMPPIPERPTRVQAETALRLLDELLDEFPFRDGGGSESVDRAVSLSELITPVLRGAMPATPMHLANAPQPGTGKSYLADLASQIATGERCAVVASSPNPEETEKRLNASALAGHPIIALDNASGTIEGDFLCQTTERPLLQLRPLGTSKLIRVANTFTVLANGNNAVVAADMVRRTIECRLDANMESPETRVFHDNPLAKIKQNRGAYVAACLTIARAYICAGKPGRLAPLASYEAWSDLVRSPLVWLGCADPVTSMSSLRSLDPAHQARTLVFRAWADALGIGGAYLTADLIERANDRGQYGVLSRPRLRDALLDIARERAGGIDARRLGRWLSKTENSVAAGLKLTSDRGDTARPRWVLIEA
jgi:putative DNA primase/helicase